MLNHNIVTQSDWLDARKVLLQQELALSKQQEAITQARSSMPWVKVEKVYDFESVR
ncbi:MAG: DUF899 family protein, partial [Pseudomonadales bacterium]|nr:DUF899 family protein [Pseudomonadales bacterium]